MLYLLALVGAAYAADLVVDGKEVVLNGTSSYETIRVINGGRIRVQPYDGAGGAGFVHLVADTIEVDAKSSITAANAGYRGVENQSGEGPGGGEGGNIGADGGGGGGHGGSGGGGSADECAYRETRGGKRYGDETLTAYADLGSGGGSAGTNDGDYGGFGGNGGGTIVLQARVLTVAGTLDARGQAGDTYDRDSAGGGAGGGIVLYANELVCTGALIASGGDGYPGDDGGGGGGGGVVKQLWDGAGSLCKVDVTAGQNGCGYESGDGLDIQSTVDWDGDGFRAADGDCAPADSRVFPGAIDLCDGIDQDCDRVVDEDAPKTAFYADIDGDSHGDPKVMVLACRETDGVVAVPDDCDDQNDLTFPGAREWCDERDNDCDGTVDEEAIDAPAWFIDNDRDGWGTSDVIDRTCAEREGWSALDGDCDDTDAAINPGAAEEADQVDDDCDGIVDEGTLIDVDGDGAGDRDGDFFGGACSSSGGTSAGGAAALLLGLALRRRRR